MRRQVPDWLGGILGAVAGVVVYSGAYLIWRNWPRDRPVMGDMDASAAMVYGLSGLWFGAWFGLTAATDAAGDRLAASWQARCCVALTVLFWWAMNLQGALSGADTARESLSAALLGLFAPELGCPIAWVVGMAVWGIRLRRAARVDAP